MTLFDAPSRESCRISRSRTNTPLQALVLMNSVTFLEASRVLAERAMKRGGATDAERLRYLFRTLLSRNPTPAEASILKAGFDGELAHYKSDLPAAKALIAQGDAPKQYSLDAAHLATYELVANTILNLDEAITKE